MRIRHGVLFLVLSLAPPPSCGDTTDSQPPPAARPETQSPPPGYQGINEGARGRINATDDHARAGESPTNERRP